MIKLIRRFKIELLNLLVENHNDLNSKTILDRLDLILYWHGLQEKFFLLQTLMLIDPRKFID